MRTKRSRLTAIAAVAAAALPAAAPAPARADLVLDGRGFGHGVGLQQWGAFGYAQREGRSFRWILGHYYAGTAVERRSTPRIRVLLKKSRTVTVASATVARDARGRAVRLRATRRYRASAWRDGLRLRDRTTGRVRAKLHGTVRISGGSSTMLRGRSFNELHDRSFRGALRLVRDGRSLRVVNDVAMEHYLYGVVPAEMPASWPREALRAQAVAARSYAFRSLRPGEQHDVLPDQSNQVYAGVEGEAATTTAAVRATRGLMVTFPGGVAMTYFSSSSGGRTEDVRDAFSGGLPSTYLVAVADPWDAEVSPHHTWTARFTDRDAGKRLQELLDGAFEGLEVRSRTPTGRAELVRVHGSKGDRDVHAREIRAELGLKSTWFSVRD